MSLDQSGVAVAGAANSVNGRQSEAVTVSLIFSAPSPHAINPNTPTQSFAHIKRLQWQRG